MTLPVLTTCHLNVYGYKTHTQFMYLREAGERRLASFRTESASTRKESQSEY